MSLLGAESTSTFRDEHSVYLEESASVDVEVEQVARYGLPAAFVGSSLAIAVWVGCSLLLYSTEGIRQAAVVLASAVPLSLAAGMRVGAKGSTSDARTRVFRYWRVVLGGYLAGAVYSTFWTIERGFSATPISQGVGLALLVVVPTYAVGALLTILVRSAGNGSGRIPAMAAFGAGIGSLASGAYLITRYNPSSLVLLAAGMLALGALAFINQGRKEERRRLYLERVIDVGALAPALPYGGFEDAEVDHLANEFEMEEGDLFERDTRRDDELKSGGQPSAGPTPD